MLLKCKLPNIRSITLLTVDGLVLRPFWHPEEFIFQGTQKAIRGIAWYHCQLSSRDWSNRQR